MLVLSACSAGTQSLAQVETELPSDITETSVNSTSIDAAPTDVPQDLPEDGNLELVSTPTKPPLISTRTELAASDPATFQLDSSQVQLVEFFAFW